MTRSEHRMWTTKEGGTTQEKTRDVLITEQWNEFWN